MALDEVVQKENVHHLTRLVDGLHAAGKWVLLVLHLLVKHRIVHNHHLLLYHRSLPIELVEYCLEGVRCILTSADLDRVELEDQSVTEVQMKLACSESQVH